MKKVRRSRAHNPADNYEKLIVNPLKSKTRPQLREEARVFAEKIGTDPEFCYKAAKIAKDPANWRTVKDLTEIEEFALANEELRGFWSQAKGLRTTIATLCFSAIVQGWIQTGSNGANINWPQEFGISTEDGYLRDYKSRWIFASVNAVTYLAASVFGCWLSDPLQSMVFGGGLLVLMVTVFDKVVAFGFTTLRLTIPPRIKTRMEQRKSGNDDFEWAVLGRRGAIFAAGCLTIAALIGSSCAQDWQQLLACRAIVGLGMGAKASITPIFGAEVSPSHLRGALVMNWQLFDAFGIFLGVTANLILYRVGPLSWRFQMASACLPTLCLVTLIWTIPESPRWLLKRNRYKEAFDAMCELRRTPLQAARELFYAQAQLDAEVSFRFPTPNPSDAAEISQGSDNTFESVNIRPAPIPLVERARDTGYWRRVWQLFSHPRTRRATIAASIVMMGQQLCGINVLIFYSNTFFRDVNGPKKAVTQAVWMSWGIGLANWLFTFPAYLYIDTKGRRFLLLATYPFMLLSLLAACLSFNASNSTVQLILVGIFSFTFVLFYSMGQGPVAFAYSSEVFPLITREVGMSFAVFVNLLGAGLLTLFVPLAQTTSTDDAARSVDREFSPAHTQYDHRQSSLLGVFVAFNALALLLIFLFVPETNGARREGTMTYLSLEELNYIFQVPMWEQGKYQMRHKLLWLVNMLNWKLLDHSNPDERPPDPPTMYQWYELRSREDEEPSETTGFMSECQKLDYSGVITVSQSPGD